MIELDQARDLLRRAVETQGRDFVYNPTAMAACYYTPMIQHDQNDPRTKTGCLIGVALDLAGETRHRNAKGPVFRLHHDFPDMMTEDAKDYLTVAQQAQDGGNSWGQAYDRAEAWYLILHHRLPPAPASIILAQ